MGYLTRYSVMAKDALVEHLTSENDYTAHALLDEEECKWYEHEKDLREFSKKYPNDLIVLDGLGEGDGDIDAWKKYFVNGKMQKVIGIVMYEPFDKTKLA